MLAQTATVPDPWPVEPLRIHRWQHGSNRTAVLVLSPRVIGLEVVGWVGVDAFESIRPHFVGFLERCPGEAHIFWDCEHLDGYEAAFRDGVVTTVRTHRDQWRSSHVLFRSALIGMSVATVGLLLGGGIRSHRRRADFCAAVEQALALR